MTIEFLDGHFLFGFNDVYPSSFFHTIANKKVTHPMFGDQGWITLGELLF
jgi:hypothetical protein